MSKPIYSQKLVNLPVYIGKAEFQPDRINVHLEKYLRDRDYSNRRYKRMKSKVIGTRILSKTQGQYRSNIRFKPGELDNLNY